jgi:hypothetical protein
MTTMALMTRYEDERRRSKEQSKKLIAHADEVIAKFDKSWDALERAAQLYRERLEGIRDDERSR